MNRTRGGIEVTLGIGNFGSILELNIKNFRMDIPFNIKNDKEETIFLEVNLWGMTPGKFIKTGFPGNSLWSPEAIREIKFDTTIGTVDLKWGY